MYRAGEKVIVDSATGRRDAIVTHDGCTGPIQVKYSNNGPLYWIDRQNVYSIPRPKGGREVNTDTLDELHYQLDIALREQVDADERVASLREDLQRTEESYREDLEKLNLAKLQEAKSALVHAHRLFAEAEVNYEAAQDACMSVKNEESRHQAYQVPRA